MKESDFEHSNENQHQGKALEITPTDKSVLKFALHQLVADLAELPEQVEFTQLANFAVAGMKQDAATLLFKVQAGGTVWGMDEAETTVAQLALEMLIQNCKEWASKPKNIAHQQRFHQIMQTKRDAEAFLQKLIDTVGRMATIHKKPDFAEELFFKIKK